MRKQLLLSAALLLGIGASNAENTATGLGTYYDETDQAQYTLTGILRSVSANGKYAVGYDDGSSTNYITYFYNVETGDLETFYDHYMHDVANDGTVVGSMPFDENAGENEHRPGWYKDGEWHALPTLSTVYGKAAATNTAVCISPDGKYIGGMTAVPHKTNPKLKTVFPCLWTKVGENYELEVYNDIDLPENQGFMLNRMSDDGRYLVGRIDTSAGSRVLAYIKDGELCLFNKLETKLEPWIVDGEPYCDPKTGEIALFEEYYIDGLHDDASYEAEFRYIDHEGNMVGYYHNFEKNYSIGCVFNENKNDGKIQEVDYNFVTCCQGDNMLFVANGSGGLNTMYVEKDGEASSFSKAFGIKSLPFAIINDISADGRVIVGATTGSIEGLGAINQPVIIILDEPYSDIHNGKAYLIGEVEGADGFSPMRGKELEIYTPGVFKGEATFTGGGYFGVAEGLLETEDWEKFNSELRWAPEVKDTPIVLGENMEMTKGVDASWKIEPETYIVTVDFNNGTILCEKEILKTIWSVVGDFNNWDVLNSPTFTETDNKGVYTLSLDQLEGEFRIISNYDLNATSYGSNGETIAPFMDYMLSQNSVDNITITDGVGLKDVNMTLTFGEQTAMLYLEGTNAVESITSDNIAISVNNGTITVEGAENVAIFSINGMLISNDNECKVANGIYIVKANDKVAKVIVK